MWSAGLEVVAELFGVELFGIELGFSVEVISSSWADVRAGTGVERSKKQTAGCLSAGGSSVSLLIETIKARLVGSTGAASNSGPRGHLGLVRTASLSDGHSPSESDTRASTLKNDLSLFRM